MGFFAGDKPAQPLVIEPALDLASFDTASGTLTRPDSTDAGAMPGEIDQDAQTITLDWPDGTVLDQAGVWSILVRAQSAAGGDQLAASIPVIVDAINDGWHTLPSARADWHDAPDIDDRLYTLLQIAKDNVLDYAPALRDGAPIPTAYRQAQLMQARNIWNAASVDPAGDLGDGSFALTPHPLDWEIKQILRPRRAIPAVS